jgi:lipopolysaccharide transport system permease protein
VTTVAQQQPVEAPPAAPAAETVRVEPRRGWRALELRDLWNYRELLYFLALRDVKVRYKQTVLGASWVVIQPFVTMVVFSVFFGNLAKIPSNGVPYPVFAFAALVPWTFFSTSITLSANSLVMTPDLVTKIFFPRIIMPVASVVAGLIDLAVAFCFLIGIMAFYGIFPGLEVLVLPGLFALLIVTALGVGIWLAALNVEYRDVRYAMAFLVQLWLFVTPVVFPASLVPEPWRVVLALNPMAGVVEGFRWALLGTESSSPALLIAVSVLSALVILVSGLFYFRRVEDRFADVI